MTEAVPFTIDVPQATLERIRQRVADYQWHEMPVDGGWDYGTNLDYLRELCAYWVNDYDWRAEEARINRFSHFRTPVDGIDIHYIHEQGSGPKPIPLIITHGWPGSIVEFLDIIEPLAHPERFGGSEDDAFDVIAPSLIGFGWSGKPPRPMGPRAIAGHFDGLMTDVLGYDSYVAQGGDWGAGVSSWLGHEHAACKGIHLNVLIMRHVDGPQTPDEAAWVERFEREQELEMGYRIQQGTKPQTLSYAMMDSPVGVAAWILEKMRGWSDLRGGEVGDIYSKDQILTNIMVYLVTGTFNTASWIYYGRREEGGRVMDPDGKRCDTPTGCALFPRELLSWPPRSYVERIYNVTHWSEFPRGGHFAAMEQPDALIGDIRAFARSLRGR